MPLLLGIMLAAASAYGGKDILVKNVSPHKAARALQRFHLGDGVRKFVLERLLPEVASARAGGGSILRVKALRWGRGIWYAPRTAQGSKAIKVIVPRRTQSGGESGVIVYQGVILGDGVLTRDTGQGFLVDPQGAARPTTSVKAWGWE